MRSGIVILMFSWIITFPATGQPGKIPPEPYLAGELFTGQLQAETYLDPDWIKGDIWLSTGGKISDIYL